MHSVRSIERVVYSRGQRDRDQDCIVVIPKTEYLHCRNEPSAGFGVERAAYTFPWMQRRSTRISVPS